MAEEPKITLPTEELRHCPSCGARVAAMATSCLMCGASLEPGEEGPEEVEEEPRLPLWARAVIIAGAVVVVLVVIVLGLGLTGSAPSGPTATPTPTRQLVSPVTLTPAHTPTPTDTPSPIPPLVHQVVSGDSLSNIAATYGTSVDAILAINPDVRPEALQVGYLLLIPAGTLTPTPTATLDPSLPTPTPGTSSIHIVSAGDTLTSIAEQYGVEVEELVAANSQMLVNSDAAIFPGQSLVVPLATPVPSPTPTPDPDATSTPRPLFGAPWLLNPADGAVIAGSDQAVLLQWASVGVLSEGEWYALTLFQPPGGTVSSTVRIRSNAWRLSPDLLLTLGDEAEFRWRVDVVRQVVDEEGEVSYVPGSVPGDERTFVWLKATPAAVPSATPTPTPEEE